MSAKVFLRIAAVLILIHLLGHLVGHSIWDKPEDPKLMTIVTAMKGYESEFMGATKSIADYHHGYSTILIVVFAMCVAILWLVSGSFVNNRNALTRALAPVGIAYVLMGIIEYIYFFPFAASISFLAGACVILAITQKTTASNPKNVS